MHYRPFTYCPLLLLLLSSDLEAQPWANYWDSVFHSQQNRAAFAKQGFRFKSVLNSNGIIGEEGFPYGIYGWNLDELSDTLWPGLEYPARDHHLNYGGIWVGGILRSATGTRKVVSTAISWQTDGQDYHRHGEFASQDIHRDTIYRTSMLNELEPNRRGFDDDADGRIDEDDLDGYDNDGDWLINRDDLNHNGRPDHGEPNVDEDYAAISEDDVYVGYSDSITEPQLPQHVPLGIRIWQKSYAWKERLKEPILPFEFRVVNKGIYTLERAFIGLSFEAMHLRHDVPEEEFPSMSMETYTGYYPHYRTFYSNFISSKFKYTPIGITLLGNSPTGSESIRTVRWGWTWVDNPSTDNEKYDLMSSGIITPDTYYPNRLMTTTGILAIGPYERFAPGDTITFAVAFVSGDDLEVGTNTLKANAAKALDFYNHNYISATAPPSPPLRITPVENGIRLDWQWRPGDPKFDPMETWDDSNRIVNALPDTHWRRRNPPPGKSAGGRVIEGFRIWRSNSPAFQENQFNLLYQLDVTDDLGFEGQTGIRFSFIDSTILRGKSYWYTITSFTIPDYMFLDYTTATGHPAVDTLLSEPVESRMFENVLRYSVPFLPSQRVGEVKVVPNPYRTDQNYIYEQGGWEGLGRLWTENRRVVWFIHLPPKCTIRIFSLAGEVIKTISHDDNDRQSRNLAVGQEEFELLSESNRALASGIYIYLVESEFGTQTGKFVVIR